MDSTSEADRQFGPSSFTFLETHYAEITTQAMDVPLVQHSTRCAINDTLTPSANSILVVGDLVNVLERCVIIHYFWLEFDVSLYLSIFTLLKLHILGNKNVEMSRGTRGGRLVLAVWSK